MPGLRGQGRRRSSPSCWPGWQWRWFSALRATRSTGYRRPPSPPCAAVGVGLLFQGSLSRSGYRRPSSPQNRPYGSLRRVPPIPSKRAVHPLGKPLKPPPPTTNPLGKPYKSQPTLIRLPKTNQFRRNAPLVPAKPRTHPSQMPKGSEATEPQGSKRSAATEPKASQAQRRRREPKGQPSEARQPNHSLA